MKRMPNIFYSFTFGGEALSLAAAKATIEEIESKSVISYLWKLGAKLQAGTNALIGKYGLGSLITVKGKPCWQVWSIQGGHGFTDLEIKSFLQQEVIAAGFLWYGQHNMSFSHTRTDVKKLLQTYDLVLRKLHQHL